MGYNKRRQAQSSGLAFVSFFSSFFGLVLDFVLDFVLSDPDPDPDEELERYETIFLPLLLRSNLVFFVNLSLIDDHYQWCAFSPSSILIIIIFVGGWLLTSFGVLLAFPGHQLA
jgi:hypothetical protein